MRRALLEALRELTEQDFAAAFEGTTVVVRLAALATAERQAVRRAREAVGAEPRPVPPTGERERVLPPQVIHDLAGARHETLLFLGAIDDRALQAEAGGDRVARLLEALAEREAAAAAGIAARPWRT